MRLPDFHLFILSVGLWFCLVFFLFLFSLLCLNYTESLGRNGAVLDSQKYQVAGVPSVCRTLRGSSRSLILTASDVLNEGGCCWQWLGLCATARQPKGFRLQNQDHFRFFQVVNARIQFCPDPSEPGGHGETHKSGSFDSSLLLDSSGPGKVVILLP